MRRPTREQVPVVASSSTFSANLVPTPGILDACCLGVMGVRCFCWGYGGGVVCDDGDDGDVGIGISILLMLPRHLLLADGCKHLSVSSLNGSPK